MNSISILSDKNENFGANFFTISHKELHHGAKRHGHQKILQNFEKEDYGLKRKFPNQKKVLLYSSRKVCG